MSAVLPSDPIEVGLVGDHLLFRDIIARTCEREFGWKIVGQVETESTARCMLDAVRPALIFVDICLPEGDGFSVAKYARLRYPTTKIVFISSYCNDVTTYRVSRFNPDGFIDKNTAVVESLREAHGQLLQGSRYFSASFREMNQARVSDSYSFDKILTNMEMALLPLIGEFCSDNDIALRLGISPATVRTHRDNLRRKLGLHSTVDLVEYAIRHGFVSILALQRTRSTPPEFHAGASVAK